MPFAYGTFLGSYQILSPLGVGGMGEVYRAKDTKLGRDVALKILPASFTNDPEHVARFRREAQVLASLNHPHIAQIYGLEEANDTQFLVLELVDGDYHGRSGEVRRDVGDLHGMWRDSIESIRVW
jgi:serine/threonine protein kinase